MTGIVRVHPRPDFREDWRLHPASEAAQTCFNLSSLRSFGKHDQRGRSWVAVVGRFRSLPRFENPGRRVRDGLPDMAVIVVQTVGIPAHPIEKA